MKSISSTAMAVLFWMAAIHLPATAAECAKPAFPGAFDCQVTVEQGWTETQQLAFWFTGQGSNIIPYGWFLNLEKANSSVPFSSADNIKSYRHLAQTKLSRENPDGLPIGFTKDVAKGNDEYRKISKEWLGLTCAACHTGQLEYKGRKVLIDGAPSMSDFQSFFEDMTTAMRATLNNPAKLKRFTGKVIDYNRNDDRGATNEVILKNQLITVTETLEKRNAWNSGDIRFGNARLDALGSILNQVLVALKKPELMKEGAVTAPVSYPFIWDTPQHDRVQWNGSVVNAGLGAVGRNVGEVIGVFGSLVPKNSVNIC